MNCEEITTNRNCQEVFWSGDVLVRRYFGYSIAKGILVLSHLHNRCYLYYGTYEWRKNSLLPRRMYQLSQYKSNVKYLRRIHILANRYLANSNN